MCWDHESEKLKEAWVTSHQEPHNPLQDPMDFPMAIWPTPPSGQ